MSQLGGGSLFWFTVRLKHQVAPISLKHRRMDSLANIKVLVVDDNATNGRVLHYQLAALTCLMSMHLRGESSAHAPYRRRGRYTLPPGDPGHADARYDGRLSVSLVSCNLTQLCSRTRKIMLTSLGLRLESRVMYDAGISECLFKPVKEARLFEWEAFERRLNNTGPWKPNRFSIKEANERLF